MGGIARLVPSRRPSVARTDSRLGRIVRVLGDHTMLVVSGTKLAEEIGVSRSEVWRLIQQLRSLGVQIAGQPLTGYRLEAMPDLLLPHAIDPLIKGTMFAGHIHHYFRIGSTNVAAMQEAQAGEPEGTVLFSEEQTGGRGRGGHSWHSARSAGIYVSIIFRPQMTPANVLALSLMAGVAAAAAVEEVAGVKADLRWPNDLLLPHTGTSPEGSSLVPADENGACRQPRQRKFCGILTELNAEATRVRYAVVGLGINVNQQEFPPDLADVATSLRMETGREWSRVELAAALLQSFDREYRWMTGTQIGSTPGMGLETREVLFRRFERASSYVRGRRVEVAEDGGYTGITEGLDGQGFLLVRKDDDTLKTVLSGGVRAIE